jgi:hypothetical protein
MDKEQPDGITAEWLDELLEAALPAMLARCAESKLVAVADFVKLVELDRRLHPPEPVERVIEWVEDWDLDEAA